MCRTSCILAIVVSLTASINGSNVELCVHFRSGLCPGGNQSLSDAAILVYYNYTGSTEEDANNAFDILSEMDPEQLEPLMIANDTCVSLNLSAVNQSQFILLEQYGHGGGQCNCLNVTISANGSTTYCQNKFFEDDLCGEFASHPRRAVLQWTPQSTPTDEPQSTPMDGESDTMGLGTCLYMEEEDFERQCSPFNSSCTNTTEDLSSQMDINFSVIFNQSMECDTIDSLNEGIEFSVRLMSEPHEWIPLAFIYLNDSQNDNNMDDTDFWNSRGYENVRLIEVSNNDTKESIPISISISNYSFTDSFQFRWIQTSTLNLNNEVSPASNDYGSGENLLLELDLWSLENITITYYANGTEKSSCIDPMLSLRNENYSTSCTNEEPFGYTFGGETILYQNSSGDITSSRLAMTDWYNTSLCNAIDPVEMTESVDPKESVSRLLGVIRSDRDIESSEIAMQLISVVPSDGRIEGKFDPQFVKDIASVGRAIEQSSMNTQNSQEAADSVTTFLQVIESLLFNYFPVNETIRLNNIALRKVEVNITRIDQHFNLSLDDPKVGEDISFSLPKNLLSLFAEKSSTINVTSALYRNFSSAFTQELLLRNESELVSDIVSASLQCGLTSCNTSDLKLTSNVTITFEHSVALQNEIHQNESLEIVCAFLQIQETNDNNSNTSLPFTGQWLTRGCSRVERLSSMSRTVCGCNHLTHFALLLSPRPPVFSFPVTLSLTIIGYIGVSISVLAMTATILVFICLRSLHSMRNYIHINLCFSLSIAQIIFVAGIDRTGPGDDPVPIHCKIIAVLLHYFFLVTFMWMLMEGVVLYVALVRVFVVHRKRYISAFTISSYGIPLLYVGGVCVPLGFYSSDQYYGSKELCFLNHQNHFIWAFIFPVIIIFTANFGFLVMAAVIMYRHQMKETEKSKFRNALSWLRGLVTLAVIMCLTWVMGLLIIEVEELLPLAYIYTILVAFQGCFIFMIFIVFSKVVRDAIRKWWRNKINDSDIVHMLTKSMKANSSNTLTKSVKLTSKSNPSFPDNQIVMKSQNFMNDKSDSLYKSYSIDNLNKDISMEICDRESNVNNVPDSSDDNDEEWPEYSISLSVSDAIERIESSASFPLN